MGSPTKTLSLRWVFLFVPAGGLELVYFECMKLILIQGLPATGKTTLGKQIAEALHIPFFSRDAYKELLFDAFGESEQGVAWSRKLGAASFELIYLTIETILRSGNDCVVETYWDAKFAEPRLKDLFERYNVRCVQIFCKASVDELAKRFEERSNTTRHAAHMDMQRIDTGYLSRVFDVNNERNKPLNLSCKLIEIDTTDFEMIDVQHIVEEIRRS